MRSMYVLAAASVAAMVSTQALAQSRSSFLSVPSISGIVVTPLSVDEFQVSLMSGATFAYAGNSYRITDIIGFWALSNDENLDGSTSGFGDWRSNKNNAGTGGILGWRSDNANVGIHVNGSTVFKFDSVKPEQIDQWGFHVRIDGTFPGTSGNTGHITIPAPTTLGAAGLAMILVPARRRR